MFTGWISNVGPRQLRAELQRDPLVGLDADRQHVRLVRRARRCREQPVRRLLEHQRHLGDLLGHGLGGAQVERHPRPAPVVDEELHRDVGLGDRRGRNASLLLVAGDPLAADRPRPGTARARCTRRTCPSGICAAPSGPLTFSSRSSSALMATGGSMAVSAMIWKQVVLHHVPQDAGPPRGSRAPLDADRLGAGDLHVVDVLVVPEAARRCRWRSGRPSGSATVSLPK